MTFLGHVVYKDGIMVDLAKVITVGDWARTTYLIEVDKYIKLEGYYKWFVEGFSSIVVPLTRLT